ncbi:hypothetical protein N3K66_007732 [Trichothecium roseum]|uniref:Uncharacterized protein n=1 Tax=Trichothecium roseum TaxID=47278 RepID=A0ACC0UUS5_9HYPO|nr:hypothetical protein N3K66_007732 [Trichothecium roseum]
MSLLLVAPLAAAAFVALPQLVPEQQGMIARAADAVTQEDQNHHHHEPLAPRAKNPVGDPIYSGDDDDDNSSGDVGGFGQIGGGNDDGNNDDGNSGDGNVYPTEQWSWTALPPTTLPQTPIPDSLLIHSIFSIIELTTITSYTDTTGGAPVLITTPVDDVTKLHSAASSSSLSSSLDDGTNVTTASESFESLPSFYATDDPFTSGSDTGVTTAASSFSSSSSDSDSVATTSTTTTSKAKLPTRPARVGWPYIGPPPVPFNPDSGDDE